MDSNNTSGNDMAGIWYGVLAYTAWGILPLYWKLLKIVPAQEILAHRILWSFVYVGILLCVTGQSRSVITTCKDRKSMFLTFATGFLISLNWFTYIWAVNSDKVIEASMGYYINPLVSVLFGVVLLKEKLNRWQIIAIISAATGVIILTVQYGRVPVVALILASTFGLYGLAKKLIKVDSMTGLMMETMAVTPLALLFILSKEFQGTGAMSKLPLPTLLILLSAGVATATPLLWFAKGAKRVTLTTLGFLQYISPTISLFLGIFIFKETFSATHFLSFSFIWLGLIIFIFTNIGLLSAPHKTSLLQPVETHMSD